ncbi:Fur family transcriptional regulator [Dehalogenimonas formicexedens]|uniref:Fur family transcriptional regulator n=1 Tax=Dehalogenimonas formicexedens TaxID=1839801 RepID=A0A1P8FA78_9CHLR|nr:Fur family transcriptional regulator [Dehalogenimonas formicexedens]APV45354.1 Fur family transcriptional regulator [Dehalogenimonas formicexedens]
MENYGLLKKKGLKLSLPRKLVLNYLSESAAPPTAEQIIDSIRERYFRVSPSTLKRTVDFLEHEGCICAYESDAQRFYYLSKDGPHHHLICEKCGKVIPCDDKSVSSFLRVLKSKYGFQINQPKYVVRGSCAKCAAC